MCNQSEAGVHDHIVRCNPKLIQTEAMPEFEFAQYLNVMNIENIFRGPNGVGEHKLDEKQM